MALLRLFVSCVVCVCASHCLVCFLRLGLLFELKGHEVFECLAITLECLCSLIQFHGERLWLCVCE